MIQSIGIKKNVPIEIREKFTLLNKHRKETIKKLLFYCNEVVIISTCNRTELYFDSDLSEEKLRRKVFKTLEWDEDMKEYCFYLQEEQCVRHLMEVVCGFHSRITGEDQILGQVRNAYMEAIELKSVHSNLQRLFEEAISCGKKFRTEGKLYEIPVSVASIAVNEAMKYNIKTLMVFGYGEIGKLVVKYALSHNINLLYLVVRDTSKDYGIKDKRVKIIDYEIGRCFVNEVDAVISCTGSPHLILEKYHIDNKGEKQVYFDLALPRDIEASIGNIDRITLYDVDTISSMDDENKKLRIKRMQELKHILNKHIDEYMKWKSLRKISEHIANMKKTSNLIVDERVKTFKNKALEDKDIKLAKTMIKSTSDYYVNRAIEVLKEESLKGSEDECLRILEKIFMIKQ